MFYAQGSFQGYRKIIKLQLDGSVKTTLARSEIGEAEFSGETNDKVVEHGNRFGLRRLGYAPVILAHDGIASKVETVFNPPSDCG